jgi:DNA helicase-2/ATP-dependent DNA helicase PcrA
MLSEVSDQPLSSTPGGELSLLGAGGREGLAETRERLLDGLSDAQCTAVCHPGPWLVINGVAGSGKTRVLATRFQWLVAGGSPPQRIAVLVPTAARAAALRARLEVALTGGYERLYVLTPGELAELVLRGSEWPASVLSAGDRLALLLERIDQLPLRHHDFGGRPNALLASFVRRIDRLKAELVDAGAYREWAAALEDDGAGTEDAAGHGAAVEREFAEIYATHERLLDEAGARDEGGRLLDALALLRRRAGTDHAPRFDHLLIDDAQELDLAAATLAFALPTAELTVAGDPSSAVRRYRGAGAERMASFATAEAQVVELPQTRRCPPAVWHAARAALLGPEQTGHENGVGAADGQVGAPSPVELWRCANDRSQAQAIAVEVERLVAREGVAPARVAVLVPEITIEGQALSVALEERAVAHRLVGEAAFFQRAEIRDLLAWLRLLADPTDAPAVVRALARPPIELRSVDIARCTQIARRRKLDMVGALAAALESPQVPPEARERIHSFLKLYGSATRALDSSRPDLYVHRLIERLGLRRQQLFAAQADVVERLRALAEFGELAAGYVARVPQATPREFARSVSAVADFGLRALEEPELTWRDGDGAAAPAAETDRVQILALSAAGGLEADHVFVCGLHGSHLSVGADAFAPIPAALLHEPLPADDASTRERAVRQLAYVALSRARRRLVLTYPRADDRGEDRTPAPVLADVAVALGGRFIDRQEELFGPAEALHSTYRLLRDELLEGTMRAAGRLGELRFDTDLDVSHAVVRYLELLKVAALIARPEDQTVIDSLRDVNTRISQAITSEQREIFESSGLDDYLLDAERDARARAQAVAARDEPSLEAFLPLRGGGVVLSATDIDTYRSCPLKYKFARVFRIPQEPTLHQRFGILVHQVLERYHARSSDPGGLPELLGLLDAGWRRGGFGTSEEERQLRGKATSALTRYHERFQIEDGRPEWFERQFQFKLGPHLVRGRVDRVDLLPDGAYELIDYKTGRPKSAAQLADDVQLSLYAVGARESWHLDASRQAYYYLLDDEKVAVLDDDGERGEWVCEVATEVAEGIQSQGFEPTPSLSACSICDYRLICPAAER